VRPRRDTRVQRESSHLAHCGIERLIATGQRLQREHLAARVRTHRDTVCGRSRHPASRGIRSSVYIIEWPKSCPSASPYKAFASTLAMTAVLHTHSRRLEYHPHVHLVVPGGGLNKQRKQWSTINGKYLFNAQNLATVFRGKLLFALEHCGLRCSFTPIQWVAQCQHVGRGLPALKYLSRYLYRGVISNRNIVSDDGTFVTFRYKDSNTGALKTRQMRGEDFIHLVLQHTLPKGFRRARDYGFLHGNAKRILNLVHWLLKVHVAQPPATKRPGFMCPLCHPLMTCTGFTPPLSRSG
jgi:hypothetical protein